MGIIKLQKPYKILNLFKKIIDTKLVVNIKLAYLKTTEIPTLPPLISKFYSHISIRIFRVIGGVCFILVASGYIHLLSNSLHLLITVTGAMQVTLILIVTSVRILYSIYRIICFPKDFEIRNSPLNIWATYLGRIIYCAKAGCSVTGGGATIIAAGVSYDAVLDEAGESKRFVPLLAEGYKAIFGVNLPKIPSIANATSITEESLTSDTVKSQVDAYIKLTPAQKTEYWAKIKEEMNKK